MAEGGRNLRIKPFTVDEDHIATGENGMTGWRNWSGKCDFSASATLLIRKMPCSSTEVTK